MRLVKGDSAEFVNQNRFTKEKFHWQGGYGAFTIAKSDINRVVKYIANQKEHHRNKTFIAEYIEILDDYGVDYNQKYIFVDLM
jgi:putative transposase